jgi:outer membrane protein W
MRRWMKRVALLLLAAGGLSAGTAWAQNREKAWEVMPYLGSVRFGSETTMKDLPGPADVTVIDLKDNTTFGLRFAYHITKRQEIEFWFSSISTSATATLYRIRDNPTTMMPELRVKPIELRTDFITGHGNYVFNFFPHHRDKIVPFVTAGIGILDLSTFGRSADLDLEDMLNDVVGDENSFMYNYGGGIRFFGSPKTGLRLDVRRVHFTTNAGGDQAYYELAAGVTLILGGS